MNPFVLDMKSGMRMLVKSRAYVFVCLVALAVGIGASTTMYSIVYAVILKPFPFPDQDRIVVAWKADPRADSGMRELSYPEYRDWHAQSRSFEDLAAMPTTSYGYSYTVTGNAEPKQIESARVTANFFSVLGVTPLLGRAFRSEEDHTGANPVAILTFQFWKSQFAADPHVIGSGIELSGVNFTVIGVMRPELVFPQGVDVFTPVGTNPRWVADRRAVFLQVVGRLKAGVSTAEARSELTTIVARVAEQNPETRSSGQIAVVKSLPEFITGTNRTVVFLLFAGALILLLVASVNLASLVATRAIARGGEIAIRTVLGAQRGHLFKQFLAEGLILATGGAILGVGLSVVFIRTIIRLAPPQIPRIGSASLDISALFYTLLCLVFVTLIFGFVPLWLIRERELQTAMAGSGKVAGHLHRTKLGRILVIVEITATVVLLVISGAIQKSFLNLENVKLGYDADQLFSCALFLSPTKYQQPEARRRFFRTLLERLESRPEVIAAGAVLLRPLEGSVGWDMHYSLPGQSPDVAEKNPVANFEVVTPSYFRAIGTPLLAGRTFEEDDDEHKLTVAVVSESVARFMYGSPQRALGQTFSIEGRGELSIIGVVADARYRQLDRLTGDVFVSYAQSQLPVRYIVIRTRNDPDAIASVVRTEISHIDASQALSKEATMRDLINRALARNRFNSMVFLLFGDGALLLAAVGVYGIVSDSVVKSTRELGIRIALGASPRSILIHVLRSTGSWVLLGEIIGVAVAILCTISIRAMLFGVGPIDLGSMIKACIVLSAACIVACFLPALRATQTDPSLALKE